MNTSLSRHRPGTNAANIDSGGLTYTFGSFRLIPSRQILLDGGSRVPVGGRALDLLTALVERGGELLTKQELMARAWPHAVVEESNLKVHIAALRKALKEGPQDQRFVATVVGRGYQFVAPVEREIVPDNASPSETHTRSSHNIPAALVHPVGRTACIADLVARLSQVRLLTITGPGGIGKTTVALAVAREIVEAGHCDVWFVNLSGVSDAHGIPQAIASAMGLTAHPGDILSALTHYFQLRNKPQLVVLDCCEHVVDMAAVIAEHLSATVLQIVVLTTSREPLQAVGEYIFRLEPLETPVALMNLTIDEALRYPAIELFMERAVAARSDFLPSDEEIRVVARICQRLDGIALAIELAATRLNAFGVRELHDLLDDRFSALAQGRRTAPERQRTLLATLDWSHQLLPEFERVVLRRLGIFSGGFTLAAASAVAAGDDLTQPCVIDAVATLVAKSMLSADATGPTVRYRLLDTTRDYARRKLAEAGEVDRMTRRHAEHFHSMYERADPQWCAFPDSRWIDEHLAAIDDVRAALHWAFSPRGDLETGIALTVSAVPVWMRLSSLEECRSRVEYALSQLDASPAGDTRRMKLLTALAASTLYTCGAVDAVEAAANAAFALAIRDRDPEYQLRAQFVRCCTQLYAGQFGAAEELARQFSSIATASNSRVAISEGHRLTAIAWYHMGRQTEARDKVERLLEYHVTDPRRSQLSNSHADGRDGSRALLANLLWLQGFPERAFAAALQARVEAQANGHALTISYVLAFASVPLALQTGRPALANESLFVLQDHVAKHGLKLYDVWARCLKGALLLGLDDAVGLGLMSDALEEVKRDRHAMPFPDYASIYALGLDRFGHQAEARAVVDGAIDWSMGHDALWCIPELLRAKGEILGRAHPLDVSGMSERCFTEAIEQARRQGALMLELRAATSLARLKMKQRDATQVERVLSSIYEAFTEGFATPDLKAAGALLDTLRATSQN